MDLFFINSETRAVLSAEEFQPLLPSLYADGTAGSLTPESVYTIFPHRFHLLNGENNKKRKKLRKNSKLIVLWADLHQVQGRKIRENSCGARND